MDGSQLILQTDFPEARRGYDKAQVDDYLRALSDKVGELRELVQQATQRAEVAEAALALSQEERARAEEGRAGAEDALRVSESVRAELAASLEESRVKADVGEVDVATGILAMAKRTAEAAIEEATQRAHRLVEDAEVTAAVTRHEAEQRAEKTRRDMEDEVEAARRQQLDVLASEVGALTSTRNALRADVTGLREFVDAEREKLRQQVDGLVALLSPDGPVVVGPSPDAASVGSLPVRAVGRDDSRDRTDQVSELVEGPTGPADAAVPADAAASLDDAVDGNGSDPSSVPDAADDVEADGGEVIAGEVSGEAEVLIDLTRATGEAGSGDVGAEASGTAAGGDAGPGSAESDAGVGSMSDGVTDLSDGSPRPEAVAAMREFFEGPSERRGLRRRR